MTSPLPSTEHIFNALRRFIADELEGLNILFIPYAKNDIEAAFEARRKHVRDDPGGPALVHRIENKIAQPHHGSFLAGFVEHNTSRLFGLVKKREATAVCFICQYDIERFEDLDTACKFIGYTAAFDAIRGYLHIPSSPTVQTAPLKNDESGLRRRLKAQTFATIMMEYTEKRGTLHNILKTFCACTTTPTPDFIPAENPLPLATDGIHVIYKDLKDQIPPKSNIWKHALAMADETGNTYDDISLRQWIRFCNGAQEMAWAGTKQNDIISAAVYGSDSPHIRSYAHICAEMLNMTPVPLKNTDIYNPFAEEDINERIHIRTAKTIYRDICDIIEEKDDPSCFLKKAREQTQAFLKGNPVGWCAPALIEAENAYRLFKERQTAEKDMIDNAFEASISHIKWSDIKALNKIFISLRREGAVISPDKALEIISENPLYGPYKNAFELLRQI